MLRGVGCIGIPFRQEFIQGWGRRSTVGMIRGVGLVCHGRAIVNSALSDRWRANAIDDGIHICTEGSCVTLG